MGAMAGTVGIVLQRYAGVSLAPGGVRFDPEMPARLRRLRFRVHHRGRWLEVDLTRERLTVASDQDGPDPIRVSLAGEDYMLEPGGRLAFDLVSGTPSAEETFTSGSRQIHDG